MTEDRVIDKILNKPFKIKSIEFKAIDLIFMLVLWIIAAIIRIKLYPIESADYFGFLAKWMDEIKSLGAWESLGHEISNYTSPYMYLMCIVSGFDNTLYALKTISVLFDYSASIAIFLIVYECTHSTHKSVLAMSMLLISPTVFIDSAYWCQCDIIYTSFILWALYFFFKNKSSACFIFLGIAFSFKLQTLFIIPFIIIMYLKKKNIQLFDIVYVPAIYIVMQLPACLAGRPFKDLMMVYFSQSGYYPWGTLEYPNVYALLDETIDANHHMNEISGAGTWVAIMLLGFIAYYIYTKKINLTNDFLITLALFTVAITVYSLPHMHDRYGFLIDLLAIVYGILRPKKLPVTVGFMLISLLTFMPYLIAVHIFDIRIVAIIQLALITYVGYDLYNLIKINEKVEA